MDEPACYYWDASVLLSFLVGETHTSTARAFAEYPGLHVISSLAYAETAAVLGRMAAQGMVEHEAVVALLDSLEEGTWRHTPSTPSRLVLRDLGAFSGLRGADLWHAGLVLTLSREYGEFALLSFDRRLCDAAQAAGVVVHGPDGD